MSITLCQTDEIPDPGSKSFEIDINGIASDIFIVHKDWVFTAFINTCPHTGVNLDWQEDQFLDMDNTYIQCATHDALFEITSGECVSGPCVGEYLTPVELVVSNNMLSAIITD